MGGKKLEWVIQAIRDYAAYASALAGLKPETIVRGVQGYMRNSRAPKVIDAPAGRQEPAMAKGIDYPELKRERKAEQAKAAMPADVARMAKLIAGLGRSMK